jgi:hypothetical protein
MCIIACQLTILGFGHMDIFLGPKDSSDHPALLLGECLGKIINVLPTIIDVNNKYPACRRLHAHS